ncbi:MAG: InlB B-repeat-containing protein, partial [Clostridia bacterium]|nr:InlB B-repeat-containing protein [Clostridia bacterium]
YDNEDCTGVATTAIALGSTGAVELYAKWVATNYTITYELNDGTNNVGNPATYTIETTTITLAGPTKAGYEFTGWTYEGQATPTSNVTILLGSYGNKTFTANWEVIAYTVSFNTNEGNEIEEIDIEYGEDLESLLPTPTKAGYVFAGWYTDADLTEEFDAETMPALDGETLTLYAAWEVATSNDYIYFAIGCCVLLLLLLIGNFLTVRSRKNLNK